MLILFRFRKEDFAKFLLILMVSLTLASMDASRLYHVIRAQSTLKLYVLFNVGEVLDKLLSSFGLDILDCLYNAPGIKYFLLSFVYTCKSTVRVVLLYCSCAFIGLVVSSGHFKCGRKYSQ